MASIGADLQQIAKQNGPNTNLRPENTLVQLEAASRPDSDRS